MIECTIQNQHDLKNQKQIYDFLEGWGLKVLLIAREDANGIHDTHYHVLCDNEVEMIDMFYKSTNIVFREVRDLQATLIYFTKEGKYKSYNDFTVNLTNKPKLDMKEVIEDIKHGSTYIDLVYKYGMPVVKNCYGIQALIKEMREKNLMKGKGK